MVTFLLPFRCINNSALHTHCLFLDRDFKALLPLYDYDLSWLSFDSHEIHEPYDMCLSMNRETCVINSYKEIGNPIPCGNWGAMHPRLAFYMCVLLSHTICTIWFVQLLRIHSSSREGNPGEKRPGSR